jgi:hypothetical protein
MEMENLDYNLPFAINFEQVKSSVKPIPLQLSSQVVSNNDGLD